MPTDATAARVLPPRSARHPWLSGGLFEHRVQTLLEKYRTSRTSKFQTYEYRNVNIEYYNMRTEQIYYYKDIHF